MAPRIMVPVCVLAAVSMFPARIFGRPRGSFFGEPRMSQAGESSYSWGLIGDLDTGADVDWLEMLGVEWEAGVRQREVSLSWRSYLSAEGPPDSAYVSRKKGEFEQLRQKGYKLILSLGLHDTPGWVFTYPDTRYVNQFGQVYNLAEKLYDQGDANAVFNPKVRELMANYVARVFADFGTDFVAVRIGGGRYGELTYPPATYAGSTNAYWAFDANAKAQSPTANWLPGQPSPNGEAKRFLEWYLDSLTKYEVWQIATLREHYPGPLMLLFPSWGIRPGQMDKAVGVNLNGSTSAEVNGEIQRGYDFARQVGAITDAQVVVTTTWLDADASQDSGIDQRYWSPVKYLASLANVHPLKLKLYGENTGQGSVAAMELTASQMKKYGLFGMCWFNESELFSGRYATIVDYQRLISQNGG